MYYSNGNYEAFARPEKPAGVERKSAYLVGSGLASLASSLFSSTCWTNERGTHSHSRRNETLYSMLYSSYRQASRFFSLEVYKI